VRLRLASLAVLLAAASSVPALAAGGDSPPAVTGRAYLVENAVTGEVLAARNAREQVPIASITKLMTVLVALEHAQLDDVVTVAAGAARIGESTVNLRPGEKLAVRELVQAALIQSANDAAYSLALHVGGGKVAPFVALMNKKAGELGMSDTHFVRPDGLDVAGHVSSARDVTILAEAAMQIPFVRETVRKRTSTIGGGRTLHTWNDLLGRFPRLLGVKTGHTTGAGWSEVAAARGRGTTIYVTLLGSPSRAERNDDLAELLAWGLSRYRVVDLIARGRDYGKVRLPYGKGEILLVPERPLVKVVRVDLPLVERVVARSRVGLPVRRGQRLGEVRIYAGSKLLGRRALVADRSVARPGALERAGWYTGRTAGKVWGWVTP
jgi:serine-type D-Ala-D-Ala carboxypeptidase (penicillin-binding protein 5/6)